jgi:hypothetical protein
MSDFQNERPNAQRVLATMGGTKGIKQVKGGNRYSTVCSRSSVQIFGTTGGEKEWLSGFYATPNEALGFFEFLVGI